MVIIMNDIETTTLIKSKLLITYPITVNISLINIFIDKIISMFGNIENYFDVEYDYLKLNLYTKTDFNKFVAQTTLQYGDENSIPEWLVGFSVDENVNLVIPSMDRIEYMTKVAIHELVHLLSYKIPHKEKRVKLLDEGIACFLSNQMSEKRFLTIVDDYKQNSLHKIEDFCIYNGNEFGKLNGYAYSYMIMEFLNIQFGKRKIIYWLKYPEDFLKIVPTLETDFRQYLIDKINKYS